MNENENVNENRNENEKEVEYENENIFAVCCVLLSLQSITIQMQRDILIITQSESVIDGKPLMSKSRLSLMRIVGT